MGAALHYIQDRCVPSPKRDPLAHARIEREADMLVRKKLKEFSMICDLERPVGRKELRKLLALQRPAACTRDALCCAIAMSFAALYAVLGNPRRAPSHLLAAAQKVEQSFRGWRKAVYAGAALLSIVLYVVPAVLTKRGELFIPLLLLSPSLYTSFNALGVLSRNLQTFLRSLYHATEVSIALATLPLAYAAFAFVSTSLTLVFQLAIVLVASSTIALSVAPYISRDFRDIREDIPWFIWE